MDPNKSIRRFFLILGFLCFIVSCRDDKKNMEAGDPDTITAARATSDDMKMEKMAASAGSIAGKARDSGDLETLEKALKAADLTTMLSEPGNYTVFAPSNNAFSKMKEGTLDDLMKPENKEQLKNLLEYHVVKGKISTGKLAAAIENSKGKYSFTSISGDELTAMMDGGQLVIRDQRGNKSQVVQGNIAATNGIIHIVNDVLMLKK